MKSYTLKKAELTDINEIWDVERDIASRISGKFENIADVRKYYFAANTDTFLIIVGDQCIGVVAMKIGKQENEMASLLIKRASQNKGLGRQIMQEILEIYPYKRTFLFTHPENVRALITYMKSGFVIQEWINNKYGDGEPRLKLVKLPK